MLLVNVLRYGADEPLPERRPLRAGPLSLIYQHGDLRSIRLGERELIRRIYVAVRDHNWGTIPATLSDVRMEVGDDAFRISFAATHQQGPVDFAWRGALEGDADGTLRCAMDGAARSTFLRNRIGFCVLHPADCAGARARVEHVDGSVEEGSFPDLIAPQEIVGGVTQPVRPFDELRSLAHEAAPGVWAAVSFAGEIFELEDQRNWIDGSFKIYGTPLRLPLPVEVAAGTAVTQSVTLRLDDRRPPEERAPQQHTPPEATVAIEVRPDEAAGALPRIGLGVANHGRPLSAREAELLRALRPAHLRVDLRLSDPGHAAALAQAADEARALEASLEVALHVSDNAERELQALAATVRQLRPPAGAWLVFHADTTLSSERLAVLAREHLADYEPAARFGGGTSANFTELNRSRPESGYLDPLCYSVNPQVHAFDNASLMETCATIAATLRSARAFAGGADIAVTPLTLRPRFSAGASGPGVLPRPVDARQMSLFGAGWTLGALRYLAEGGASSATFYETTGWRGVIECEAGSPEPELFRSLPGGAFPLYHVLADAAEFAGGAALAAASSAPLRIEALALRAGERVRVLLANMTNEPQRAVVRGLGATLRLRLLDETNAAEAMRAPAAFRAEPGETRHTEAGALAVDLLPYAVARIDALS